MAASLPDLIRVMSAIIEQSSKRPQLWPHWTKQQLVDHLAEIPPLWYKNEFWNTVDTATVRKSSTYVRKLVSTFDSLNLATYEKLHRLQSLASPTTFQARKWVLLALADIIQALKGFKVVTHDFQRDNFDVLHIVWLMFRRVYHMSIVIGELSFEPGTESLVSCSREFLAGIERNDFCFEKTSQVVKNALPAAILCQELDAMPLCYLPHVSNRNEPQYIHSSGSYGPQLVENEPPDVENRSSDVENESSDAESESSDVENDPQLVEGMSCEDLPHARNRNPIQFIDDLQTSDVQLDERISCEVLPCPSDRNPMRFIDNFGASDVQLVERISCEDFPHPSDRTPMQFIDDFKNSDVQLDDTVSWEHPMHVNDQTEPQYACDSSFWAPPNPYQMDKDHSEDLMSALLQCNPPSQPPYHTSQPFALRHPPSGSGRQQVQKRKFDQI